MQVSPGIQPASFTPTYIILDRKKCPGYNWYYYTKDALGNDTATPIPIGSVIVGKITNVQIKETPDNMYLDDALQVTVQAEKTYVLRTGGRSKQQGTIPSSYRGILRSLYYLSESQLNNLIAIETAATDQAESVIFVSIYSDLGCDNQGKIISGIKSEYDYHAEEAQTPDPRIYIPQIIAKLNKPGGYDPKTAPPVPEKKSEATTSQSANQPVVQNHIDLPTQQAQLGAILPPQVLQKNNQLPQVPVNPVPVASVKPQPTKNQLEYAGHIKEAAKTVGWTKEGLSSFFAQKYNVALEEVPYLAQDTLVQIYSVIQDQKLINMFCPPVQLAIPQQPSVPIPVTPGGIPGDIPF